MLVFSPFSSKQPDERRPEAQLGIPEEASRSPVQRLQFESRRRQLPPALHAPPDVALVLLLPL